MDTLTWTQEGFAYAVLRALPALLVVIDRQGEIVAANEGWDAAAYEAGSPDLVQTTVGSNYLEVCRRGAADQASGAQETLEGLQAVLNGSLPLLTLEYACPLEHETKWYLLYATPLQAAQGGAVVAHIDITRQKLLEQQLRRSREEMSGLLNLAGHELRNPLTTLRGHLQLVRRRLDRLLAPKSAPETHVAESLVSELVPLLDSVERAEAQAGRLHRLIEDLLEAGRLQTQPVRLNRVRADLADLVREVVKELQLIWPTRLLTLETPEEPVWLELDVGRIEQVVINYVTNALKYSPADRPVRVTVWADREQALVRVLDGGPGLPADALERIWERFYRVPGIEGQQETSGGLGVGLAICRSIVQQHGGHVGVESAPGAGSTFWFALPRQGRAVSLSPGEYSA